jgi:hypothetical protein
MEDALSRDVTQKQSQLEAHLSPDPCTTALQNRIDLDACLRMRTWWTNVSAPTNAVALLLGNVRFLSVVHPHEEKACAHSAYSYT